MGSEYASSQLQGLPWSLAYRFCFLPPLSSDLQTNQSALFQSLTSTLSPEQQSALQAASAQSDDLPVKNDVPGLPQN